MYTLSPSIQHCIEGISQYNKARKRNKRHPDWKGRSKLSLFIDNIIVYVENCMESAKKATRISEFNEVAGYKMNTQKSIVLYVSNKRSEIKVTESVIV